MKITELRKYGLLVLSAFVIWSCRPDNNPVAPQTEWLERTDGFQEKYELEQLLVLSRHNIRTPMVAEGSDLYKLTNPDYQWFRWQDPASHLTAKGKRLEVKMGTFFREWLQKKDFLARYSANPSSFRFYANAKERCQTTARAFADALFPAVSATVEMNAAFDTMDPVFNPQITKLPAGFTEKARQEIADMMGDLDQAVASKYLLIERVIDVPHSTAYLNGEFTHFDALPSSVSYSLNAEPSMAGGLKKACTVADALVLQYYEELDDDKADFGHNLSDRDWLDITLVKEWYGQALFTPPSVCVNVAHPLLQEMLSELQNKNRVFTFLCGHDSNVGSVLASLQTEEFDLPGTLEKKAPIGTKVIIEKFKGKDGVEYADIWMVYASTRQLREESSLSYSQPPVAVRLKLGGLSANADQLYRLQDVEQRFSSAIAAYDTL